MKKLILSFFLGAFMLAFTAQSQTLINVINLKSLTILKDGDALGHDVVSGGMLMAYNKIPVKVFKTDELSCWVEFEYKKCGKNVKLSWRTVVELSNGDLLKSKLKKDRQKIGDGDPGYFIGKSTEEFAYNGKGKNKLLVRFDYEFRYKTPS